jgi:hypothetical protein
MVIFITSTGVFKMNTKQINNQKKQDKLFKILNAQNEWDKTKHLFLINLIDEYVENDLGPATLENELERRELQTLVYNLYQQKLNLYPIVEKTFNSKAVKTIQARFNVKYPKYVF